MRYLRILTIRDDSFQKSTNLILENLPKLRTIDIGAGAFGGLTSVSNSNQVTFKGTFLHRG